MKVHLSGKDQSTACGTRSTAITVADAVAFFRREYRHSADPCRTCLKIAEAQVIGSWPFLPGGTTEKGIKP